jgi:hypothetical protein
MEEITYEGQEPPEFDEDLNRPEDGRSSVGNPVMFVDGCDDSDRANEAHAGEVNQAFGVKVFHWKDQALHPFAIDREGDWMRHRELLGEAPLREVILLPMAMLLDALRVLWFCSVDPAEWLTVPYMSEVEGQWRRLTGQERALLVEAKIREWAATNVSRQEGSLAVDTFYDIYNSTQSTRATSKPGEHHREDKAKN